MTIMKQKIQLSGILLLLLFVFTVGVKTSFDGYYGFYYQDEAYEKPIAYEITETMVKFPLSSAFATYTGFDTGYGFFAPNVASDFVLMFDIQDSVGKTIAQTAMPAFKQKESQIRYTSLFNMFLEKVKQKKTEDNPYKKYLDLILKQIALNVKKDYPQAASINAKLYLYDYPSLEKYRKGETKENAFLINEFKL